MSKISEKNSSSAILAIPNLQTWPFIANWLLFLKSKKVPILSVFGPILAKKQTQKTKVQKICRVEKWDIFQKFGSIKKPHYWYDLELSDDFIQLCETSLPHVGLVALKWTGTKAYKVWRYHENSFVLFDSQNHK